MPVSSAATLITKTGASGLEASKATWARALAMARPLRAEEGGARVVGCRRRPERLDGRACVVGELVRSLDLDGDQEVAAGAVATSGAVALDPQSAAVRRRRRDLDGDGAGAQRRNLDVGAESRLLEADRHAHREVVALAAEHVVRRDVHQDLKVAGRSAVLARRPLAAKPDALAVANAGRDPRLDGAGGGAAARAVAHRARVVDDQPAAAAVAARLGHREHAALTRGLHARSLTGGADVRHGAGAGARPRAGGAGGVA